MHGVTDASLASLVQFGESVKVLVVATSAKCPAVSALNSERIPFKLVEVSGNYSYGRALHQLWEEGESFINVEHDIVPWPGALEKMWKCKSAMCMYQYPIGHSGLISGSLGCVKFSDELIDAYPLANFGWDDTEWNHLDAQVFGALVLDRSILPDVHQPPVGHLTDMK